MRRVSGGNLKPRVLAALHRRLSPAGAWEPTPQRSRWTSGPGYLGAGVGTMEQDLLEIGWRVRAGHPGHNARNWNVTQEVDVGGLADVLVDPG